MPKQLEDCVKKIRGTNPRTNKPYTKSEKFAICNNSLKHKKDEKASIEDVNEFYASAKRRLVQIGRAKSHEAEMAVEIILANSNYDIDVAKNKINM